MKNYTCPLCQAEVPRDLALFLEHTDTHVIEEIKKKHPSWVSEDGGCRKCIEYYKKQVRGE